MHRLVISVVAASLLAWPAGADAQAGRQRDDRHDRGQRGPEHGDRGVRDRPGLPAPPPQDQRMIRRPSDHGPSAREAGPHRGRAAFRERAVVTAFAPRSGPPGTVVTIHGQRFGPGFSLVVGGQPVVPTGVTPTSITFRMPRAMQNGLILLRQPNRPDVMVGTFEVGRAPPPRRARHADFQDVARRRWTERRAQLAATEAARLEALRAQEESLRVSRAERRRRRLAAMRADFEAALLALPAAKDELALHAERIARLDRMSRLAEARLDDRLGVRIDVLRQREEQRHQERMNDIRAAFRAGQ